MKNIFNFFNIFIIVILINCTAVNNSFAVDCSNAMSLNPIDYCEAQSGNTTQILAQTIATFTGWPTNNTSATCCYIACITGSSIQYLDGEDGLNCYCPGGQKANSGNTGCEACASGTWSSDTMNDCDNCPSGYTASDNGRDAQADCYKNCPDTTITNGTWESSNAGDKAYYNNNCDYTLSCNSGYTPNCNTTGSTPTCATSTADTPSGYTCINSIDCTSEISNAASATKTWTGSAWGTCTLNNCITDYHIDSGTCVSNTRPCIGNMPALAPNDASGGEQTWNTSTSNWDYSACYYSTSYTPANGSNGENNCFFNSSDNTYSLNCAYEVSDCNAGYYWNGIETNPDCAAVGDGYYKSGTTGYERSKCPYFGRTCTNAACTAGTELTTATTIKSCIISNSSHINSTGTLVSTGVRFCNDSNNDHSCEGNNFSLPVPIMYYQY